MVLQADRPRRPRPRDADCALGPAAKRVRAEGDDETAVVPQSLSHPFPANFNDHFETCVPALRDIMVVVDQLRPLLRPSAPENFIVYDPYYCAGAVERHWRRLGVSRVIHENRDFYADIASGAVPRDYDMLVTNPPFSGDHVPRLVAFLAQAQRPFAFLVPDYTAAKEWYRAEVRRHFPAATGAEPFYLVPRGRYDFRHPRGAGNEHAHFRSMWFVWAGRRTAEVLRGVKVEFARRNRSDGEGMRVDVVHGLDALAAGNFLQFGTRANPQRRAKQRCANTKKH